MILLPYDFQVIQHDCFFFVFATLLPAVRTSASCIRYGGALGSVLIHIHVAVQSHLRGGK